MPSFFVVRIGTPPPPHPQASVPTLVQGGSSTSSTQSLAVEGVGEGGVPIPKRGQAQALYVYNIQGASGIDARFVTQI